MAIIDGTKAANENLLEVAKVAAAAALRGPKVAGTEIKLEIVTGEELKSMIKLVGYFGEVSAFIYGDSFVAKKAEDAGTPTVELLIGADLSKADLNWNCGACGFDTCADFLRYSKDHKGAGRFYVGPSCMWKVLDYGIAWSSACAAVHDMNVENRIQADYGVAGMLLGYLKGCTIGSGLSIGPCGESLWYDRSDLANSFSLSEHENFVKACIPQFYIAFDGDGHPTMKHKPDWQNQPLFNKQVEDPEFMAKCQGVVEKVGKLIKEEQEKKQNIERQNRK